MCQIVVIISCFQVIGDLLEVISDADQTEFSLDFLYPLEQEGAATEDVLFQLPKHRFYIGGRLSHQRLTFSGLQLLIDLLTVRIILNITGNLTITGLTGGTVVLKITAGAIKPLYNNAPSTWQFSLSRSWCDDIPVVD
jgi:hypothetical protein